MMWFRSVDMAARTSHEISIRGHFYFLLKLLFIAKVVLFISKNIYSNLLLMLWWEVMCCVWHAYRPLWCLCLNVSVCTELRVEYQGFSSWKSSHSVFAYRFWTKLPLYWLAHDCNCISTPQPARGWGVTALFAKMLMIQDKWLFFHKHPPTEWDVPSSNTALTQIHH